MADDNGLLELLKIHSESHSKYVYFLLGATGAALAYALQKIDGAAFTWWSAPAVAAIAFWLASFYCGCKRITLVQTAVYANYSLLQLRRGEHPKQPPDHLLHIALNGTITSMERTLNRAKLFFDLQFYFLAAGVLLFIAWRLLDMLKVTLAA